MANKITVTSMGTTANVNATPDSARYYSDKSKEWAISNRIVDNIDYSSKYYANESKKQADISTAKTTEVIASGNTAVSNIESARDNAIIDITNQENLSVDNVNTAGATQVSSVNTAGITQVANVNSAGTTQINLAKEQVTLATNQANIATEQATIATNKTNEVVASGNEALSNIGTAKTGAITDITDLKNTSITSIDTAKSEALTEIETLHSSSVTDITDLKNTSVSNITTAKNNAITTITKQETTSKNNVIATGNEQVERVNLTGVDNRTPIFSKSEIGTNEGVYQNVYDLKHSTFDLSKFTVVGSPTITDDGVASGFSNNDYVTSKYNLEDGKIYTFVVEGIGGIPRTDRGSYIFTAFYGNTSGDNNLRLIAGAKTGIVRFALGVTSTDISTKFAISNGVKYKIEVKTDFKTFVTFTDLLTGYTLTKTGYSVTNQTYGKMVITYGTKLGVAPLTNGSINLKSFSITADGKEVFSGNKTGIDVINDVEIPYTLSKTGSKIVDVAYRDRVIDLYEQEGQAGYYTIDEENKNFTLPMGEIYGMIEGKADKDMLNNPYSLFDSKYSDHELNNLSWLKSAGQWNAKAVYPTAYDKLLKVYNGTETVEGLSVKLSTETYTDYDFVLNTADETFRLPLKTKLASGKAVVGNGSALGFTQGDKIRTFIGGSGSYFNFIVGSDNYGQIGQTASDANGWVANQMIGLSSDQTKSGIELSDSGLYLYYYVGETVQNANLIDAGRIGEQLADKIGRKECKAYITETYQNGTSWYRVYSDGWCEQGGQTAATGAANTVTTVNFLKHFANANYCALATDYSTTTSVVYFGCTSFTTSSMAIITNAGAGRVCRWMVAGYIN